MQGQVLQAVHGEKYDGGWACWRFSWLTVQFNTPYCIIGAGGGLTRLFSGVLPDWGHVVHQAFAKKYMQLAAFFSDVVFLVVVGDESPELRVSHAIFTFVLNPGIVLIICSDKWRGAV